MINLFNDTNQPTHLKKIWTSQLLFFMDYLLLPTIVLITMPNDPNYLVKMSSKL